MSNSPLVVYTKLSPYCTKNRNHAIDTITIHCMAGNLSIESCGAVFQNREASSNYGIGSDGRIGMYVEEKDRSWCTSSGANDHRAVTIEVANTVAAHPWPVSDKARAALINLCEDICRRNNIKELLWKGDKSLVGKVELQNMTVHRWFANKACPGDDLYNYHTALVAEVNKRLKGDDMDYTQFKDFMAKYQLEQNKLDGSAWSKEARDWSLEVGLIAGDGAGNYTWRAEMTREQFVQAMFNAVQKGVLK